MPAIVDNQKTSAHVSFGGLIVSDSEFRLYPYIEKQLKDLGWDTRNPSRGCHKVFIF